MPTNKYYLKTVRNGHNIVYDKTLVRNCLNEEVFVNEYVDSPDITIWTDRLNQKSFTRPKSNSYEKCTPI